MSRRRRIELYAAVAFAGASVSLLDQKHAAELAGPGTQPAVRHLVEMFYFVDPIFDHYGPSYGGWFRRAVNVATAACWGIAVGFLIGLAMIGPDNRWRIAGRTRLDDPPDP